MASFAQRHNFASNCQVSEICEYVDLVELAVVLKQKNMDVFKNSTISPYASLHLSPS